MKIISWNVNGLRACMQKGFPEFLVASGADIFCIQESKMQREQADINFDGFHQFWNSAVKKGYSGTVIFSKIKPLSEKYGIGVEELDSEGRAITLEFAEFYLVNVYVPNSQDKLARIDFRLKWEDSFRAYLAGLDKPVVLCGDLNVAHNEIDLARPKQNKGKTGFSDEERGKLNELLGSGFVDSFRYKYPTRADIYTWWSYKTHARDTNVGWRIDYFLVSSGYKDKIKDALIYDDVLGSDHCPVGIVLES